MAMNDTTIARRDAAIALGGILLSLAFLAVLLWASPAQAQEVTTTKRNPKSARWTEMRCEPRYQSDGGYICLVWNTGTIVEERGYTSGTTFVVTHTKTERVQSEPQAVSAAVCSAALGIAKTQLAPLMLLDGGI